MMNDQGEGVSRRDFLRFGAGAAVGAVAATVVPELSQNSEQQERQEFFDTIKGLTYDDLKNPDQEKLKRFSEACAREYLKITSTQGITVEDLVNNAAFHSTQEEFVGAVRNSGLPNYPSDRNAYAHNFYDSKRIDVNLGLISNNLHMETEYPGVKLFDTLIHEWVEVRAVENTTGEFLNSPQEVLITGETSEQWARYRGGRVYTEGGHYGLLNFDNAWDQLITRRILMESLRDDLTLLGASVTVSSVNGIAEETDKLSRIVERAGISTQEMAILYANSDVEGMLARMGSVFKDSALETLSEVNRGGRTEEEIKSQKDFLLGKRAAFLISSKRWDDYGEMIDHIRPPTQ